MRTRLLALLLFCASLLTVVGVAHASETIAEHKANAYAAEQLASHPVWGNLPDYSLAPAKLAEAQSVEHTRNTLYFVGMIWGFVQAILLLWLGIIAWMRDRAVAAGANLRARGARFRAFWIECAIFAVLYSLAGTVLDLPLAIFGHHLQRLHGLSVQGWGGWLGDQGKSLGLGLLGSILSFALLMFMIRWLPRVWWLVFWAVLAPLTIAMIYAMPIYIDPLFNKFEPLQKTQPELVAKLELIVKKGHMDIPPERMFLMKASSKVTTINAYVTGFGGSKRVVVWDTALQKATPDEVLFIFGHESGHYVLGHVMQGMKQIFLGLLIVFFLGYFVLQWMLRRFGPQWRITAQSDWGTIAVFFFVISIFSTLLTPVINVSSRQKEHAADVYGMEAVHGIVASPQDVAQQAFVVLGKNSLVVPNEPVWLELWLENHPQIGRRAAFAHAYDPWADGVEPKYFKK
ncbi:MAG: M48 family metallopeptidase [Acidobacteriaceae bacterium]|nr:M48 family metallopeptidase [Acidobacteriaceae bacterium]